MTTRRDLLDSYRRQTRMSDPGPHAAALAALPDDPGGLAEAAQGLILHEHWAPAYGQSLSDARRGEVHLRSLAAMLDQLAAHDSRPLTEARAVENRLIGNCRDFPCLPSPPCGPMACPVRFRQLFRTG